MVVETSKLCLSRYEITTKNVVISTNFVDNISTCITIVTSFVVLICKYVVITNKLLTYCCISICEALVWSKVLQIQLYLFFNKMHRNQGCIEKLKRGGGQD